MQRNEYLLKIGQIRAKLQKIAIAGEDIFKKNKINRDLDKDTAGNKYEQDITDMLNEIAGPGNERAISKGMRNMKTNKKTGIRSFTFTTKG